LKNQNSDQVANSIQSLPLRKQIQLWDRGTNGGGPKSNGSKATVKIKNPEWLKKLDFFSLQKFFKNFKWYPPLPFLFIHKYKINKNI